MEVRDVSLSDLTADPDREGEEGEAVDALTGLVELAEVDRLVFDLTALIGAGLVEVHQPIFGPARYGVLPEPG